MRVGSIDEVLHAARCAQCSDAEREGGERCTDGRTCEYDGALLGESGVLTEDNH